MEFLKPFAQYYFFVYWLFVFLLTFGCFKKLKDLSGYTIINQRFNYRNIFIFSVFFITIYGLRPISGKYFVDTAVYANTYHLLQDFGVFSTSGNESADIDWLFFIIQKVCAHLFDVHIWFALMMMCYVSPIFLGCKKIDFRHGAILILFCFGSFEFYGYAVNGVRQGVACSFAIMAMAFLCEKRVIMAVLWAIMAIGFHKSAALPVVAMFFTYYVNKPKYMFLAWMGAVVLSLTFGDYIDYLLSSMSYDERLAKNLQENDADGLILEHRFRWDFLLYSLMPILLGWYTIFKRGLYNRCYLILLGAYIYSNAFWVLAIRAMFSNRIAYLSWSIYPIVLAYPLLNFPVFKKNHSPKTAWIFLGHFGFTTLLWLLGK